MPPDDAAALVDVEYACRRIALLTAATTREDFVANETLREAVQYRLIVAGEAVKRLTAEFRTEHPEIRWTAIAGLRDILVHAYERVDAMEICNIATRDVPELLGYIERIERSDPGSRIG